MITLGWRTAEKKKSAEDYCSRRASQRVQSTRRERPNTVTVYEMSTFHVCTYSVLKLFDMRSIFQNKTG